VVKGSQQASHRYTKRCVIELKGEGERGTNPGLAGKPSYFYSWRTDEHGIAVAGIKSRKGLP
jgi:hypothetical protein